MREVNICLNNVYIDSNSERKEVMQDVAKMEAKGDGFELIGLLGEQKFIQGKVNHLDFVNTPSVVLKKGEYKR